MIGRIPILDVQPAPDQGRRPAKAVDGEVFEVSATVFREGHERLGAGVVLRHPDGHQEPLVTMRELAPGSDRYGAQVRVTSEGPWQFRVEAWGDPMAGWQHDAGIKVPLGLDVDLMMAEGALLFDRAARAVRAPRPHAAVAAAARTASRMAAAKRAAATAKPARKAARVAAGAGVAGGDGTEAAAAARQVTDVAMVAAAMAAAQTAAEGSVSTAAEQAAVEQAAAADRAALAAVAAVLRDSALPPLERLAAASTPQIEAVLAARPLRTLTTRTRWYPVTVHRQRALYGAWYEFFPRSEGAVVPAEGLPQSGTLRTAMARLDAVAEMGFDVVYLPPVHPIGTTARKGPNNSLYAHQGDPGSPWAIGSSDGGHDSLHPDLGSMADFDAFVARARSLGLEVALDLALQASPDHPWVDKHPEWFTTRADGTIAYAENPPKRYQDIYPLNFDNDPEGIYAEMLRVVRLWMDHGIRIFRVDNPHTKPLRFWERLLADVARTDPDVLFLAEAFTRPAMMSALALIGFHQSYTYFTWRNTSEELTEYLQELSGEKAAIMRPNFFVNTPDILCQYLQHAGPAAFMVRAVLASMLAPSWGVYAGYELGESIPAVPGSEEYLDSEKYQYRPRDWAGAAAAGMTLAPFLTQLNRIRRAHPALHQLRNLRFHPVDQPDLLCFSKDLDPAPGSGAGRDIVLVVVNLDWRGPREATVWLDMPALGLDHGAEFLVRDELSGESYWWRQASYVRLDPSTLPAHIFSVRT